MFRLTAVLISLLMAGLTALPATAQSGSDSLQLPMKIGPRVSPFGHYLAARHAQIEFRNALAAQMLSVTQSRYPDDTALSDQRLSLLLSEGEIDRAAVLARKALERDPGKRDALWVMFLNHFKGGRIDQAEKLILRLEEEQSDVLLASIARTWLEVAKGDFDAANDGLDPLRDLGGLNLIIELQAAIAADLLNDESASTRYGRISEAVQQPSLRVADLMANWYERSNEPERAAAIYDEYLIRNPNEVLMQSRKQEMTTREGTSPQPLILSATDGLAETLYHLSGLLFNERQEHIAVSTINSSLYLNPASDFSTLFLAQMLESQNIQRYEDSLALYNRIDAESPLHWRAQLAAANAKVQLDRKEEAETDLKALLDVPQARFDALLELGDLYRFEKRYEDSAAQYAIALAEADEPAENTWQLNYYHAIALERSKKWDEAEAAFFRALELEPRQPNVMNYLAYSWVEMGINLERAEDMLIDAVDQRPNDGYIIDSLGWVYYQTGQYEKAVAPLEEAVNLRPQDPVINDHLGDAFWRVGRFAEARFQWKRALSFDPEPEEIEKIEAKLENGLTDETASDSSGN